jgi:DNA repair protein RadC
VHQTTVDVRLVLKHALLHLASAVVLCHNHPSGSRMPSLADKNLTKQIIEAARWMEIKILDHIIIAGDSYYSFSDENTLTL